MTEAEATAVRLVGFWWACVEAGRDIDGEPRIPDDAAVLHQVSHGCTAMVTAAHLRTIANIDLDANELSEKPANPATQARPDPT